MSLYPMPASDTKQNAKRTSQPRAPREATLTQLVARAQSGDMRSFDALVARFQDRTVGRSAAILGDAFGAQDVAQEAFVEAYRRLGELRIPAAFPSLLEALIRKHCDRVTRRRRFVTVSLGEPSGLAETLPADASSDPARRVVAQAQRESVREVVRALPDAEREIILLFYVGGQSHKEIAASLNLPVCTVKSRLHESRLRLKRRMIPMIEETLATERPSRSDQFQKRVRNSITSSSHASRSADFLPKSRQELEGERQELEARIAAEPMNWDRVNEAVSLYSELQEYPAAADLMTHYLAQSRAPSEEACIRLQRLTYQTLMAPRGEFLRQHQEFLEWMRLQIPLRTVHINGGRPVAADSPECLPNDCLLLWALFPESAWVIWANLGRAAEYLDLSEAILDQTPQTAASRSLRAVTLECRHQLLSWEKRYDEAFAALETLEFLADEPEQHWDSPFLRIRAAYFRCGCFTGKTIIACASEKREPTAEEGETQQSLAKAALRLVEEWEPLIDLEVTEQRECLIFAFEMCANRFREIGDHERAVALFRRSFTGGLRMYPSFMRCAASLWSLTKNREETLELIRQGVVCGTGDPRNDFRDYSEFADVHDDPEFLTALSAEQ